MKGWRYMVIVAALLALLMLCGCSRSMIKEDSVHEDLPDIDPEAGVAKEVQAKLYYRLTDEEYLVGVSASVTVYAGEREEKAMIRSLIEGTPPLSGNISAVVPKNTEIIDVMLEGAIMYVTLSESFFDTSVMDKAVSDVSRLMENSMITKNEYELRVQAAKKELYLSRRLAVESIVNTITANNPDVKVQLLFELEGTAARVSRTELGLEGYGGSSHDLLEPMEFVGDCVITPTAIADCVLGHMQRGEYDKAYPLIAELEQGGAQKPDYASFETEAAALDRIRSYSIKGERAGEESGAIIVTAEITKADAAAGQRGQRHALSLKPEGSIYKVGYTSLLSALGGNGE